MRDLAETPVAVASGTLSKSVSSPLSHAVSHADAPDVRYN
jgi:hypothetical protein